MSIFGGQKVRISGVFYGMVSSDLFVFQLIIDMPTKFQFAKLNWLQGLKFPHFRCLMGKKMVHLKCFNFQNRIGTNSVSK